MAVVVGDVLPEPAPEGLDRPEVGAVARQRYELDPQRGGGLAHHTGAMIGSAVPHDPQLPVGPFGPPPAQNIGGVLAVGAGLGPEPHLALVVEIEAIEWRACPPNAASPRRPRSAGRAP